jgi:hypothetical protein
MSMREEGYGRACALESPDTTRCRQRGIRVWLQIGSRGVKKDVDAVVRDGDALAMQNPQMQELQRLQQLQQLQELQQMQQMQQMQPQREQQSIVFPSSVHPSAHEMMPISPSELHSTAHAPAAPAPPSVAQTVSIPEPLGASEILAASRKFRVKSGAFEWISSMSSQHSSNRSQVSGALSLGASALRQLVTRPSVLLA